MKKLARLLVALLLSVASLTHPPFIRAVGNESCLGSYGVNFLGGEPPSIWTYGVTTDVTFKLAGLPKGNYIIYIDPTGPGEYTLGFSVNDSATSPIITISDNNFPEAFANMGRGELKLRGPLKPGGGDATCDLWAYNVVEGPGSCNISLSQAGNSASACVDIQSPLVVNVTNLKKDGALFTGEVYLFLPVNATSGLPYFQKFNVSNGSGSVSYSNLSLGQTSVKIQEGAYGASKTLCSYPTNITVKSACTEEEKEGGIGIVAVTYDVCQQVGSDYYTACNDCKIKQGIWTGLGCLSLDPVDFVKNVLTIAAGLAGGIAFLIMLQGAFMITTAAGVPDQIQKGKEKIGGAVAGLVFVVFAVVLLNLIGVSILAIPGL